jgi:signal transduction histidine kinase
LAPRSESGRVHPETYPAVVRAADATGGADRYREVVTTATRWQRLKTWFDGLNPWVVDGAVAVLFAVIGLATTSGRGQVAKDLYEPQDALSVVLVLASSLPFVFRRRYPLAVLMVCTTAVVINSMLGHNEGATPFFLWVAVITVAATCSIEKVIVAAVWIFAGLLALVVAPGSPLDGGGFGLNCALFAAMFMFGTNLKNRKERIDALEDRAAALEREKEEEARRAVADERLHIARELHDVVAHSMGVIAVQASVGGHVIDDNPAEAKRALEAISGVSRSTLAEIRRMLGVLRETDAAEGGAPAYSPAPGLGDLGRLVHELDGAGVPVAVSYEGPRVELPRGVDLTAYRIVQEALTNVLKHAGPASATVLVRYEPGALALEIVDDGRGVNGRVDGRSGHGLVGMRERVAVYGGTLDAGPKVGGGFRVAVCLPYEDSQ